MQNFKWRILDIRVDRRILFRCILKEIERVLDIRGPRLCPVAGSYGNELSGPVKGRQFLSHKPDC
jgi:hypothetical protein